MRMLPVICFLAGIPATSSAQIPPAWSDAVRLLAEKIAADISKSRSVTLDAKNISSLGAAEAGDVRIALEAELAKRNVRVVSFASTSAATVPGENTEIRLTLSEGAEGYVWVAEIRNPPHDLLHELQGDSATGEATVEIVSAPKAEQDVQKVRGAAVIEKKLVWTQPQKILDFAVSQKIGTQEATLWILEPERLAFYGDAGGQWQFDRAISITHSAPWPRDVRAQVDASDGVISLPGMQCVLRAAGTGDTVYKGDTTGSQMLQCTATRAQSAKETALSLNGLTGGGDALQLDTQCEGSPLILSPGSGDWTQPDSIQAFLAADGRAAPSGNAVETPGPVTAFYAQGAEGGARAVVHNLQTGDYEAYFVSASCSR
jgi:hypothetical protein